MRLRFFVLLGFLLPVLACSWSAAAQSRLHKAQELWGKKNYEGAIALLQPALKERNPAPELFATLGGWLYRCGRFPEAADVFATAQKQFRKNNAAFRLPLARCLFRAGRYREAAQALSVPAAPSPEADRLLHSVRWAAVQSRHAVVASPLGPFVNSSHPESFPQLSADGSKLYFTRRVNGIDDDLMQAVWDSCGEWASVSSLPYPVNSRRQERAQMVSADGHYIFFGRDDIRSEDGWTGGGADLYMSYSLRPGDTVWTTPLPFGATINTPSYEGMPVLSPDNQMLYFVSDRPGGYGGLDIWYSHFRNGLWRTPVNAGPEINTSGNDISPFLAADGQSLFFASDGQSASFGGYDLYRARRADTFWTRVENLGLPVNSAADDLCPAIGIEGDTLYFATDRQNSGGNTDLWRCALPDALRPQPMRHVRGWVIDSLTQGAIPNAWVQCQQEPEQASVMYRSNRGDGSFSAFLKPGMSYRFSVMQSGYQQFQQDVQPAKEGALREDTLRLALLPESYVAPQNDSLLLRLHFRRNEVFLSDTMLRQLAALRPDLEGETHRLLIRSYTDDSGTPLLNEELSAVRAARVAAFLQTTGLPAEKLDAQGMGEREPLAPNDTEAARDQNRRVEILLRR